jgi:phthalate 4,5-dioxygenase oxygenase subunit
MEAGAEPPALDANKQHVRAAGVLLERGAKPQEWAKTHLADASSQPVYSI